jgi:hypothetical protein
MPIWFALLAAPLLALGDQAVSYASVGWACAHQQALAVHAVHALFFTTAVVATFPAWQLWRSTRSTASGDETVARRHFLAGLATASSTLSALVIAAMWMPTWVISLCSN